MADFWLRPQNILCPKSNSATWHSPLFGLLFISTYKFCRIAAAALIEPTLTCVLSPCSLPTISALLKCQVAVTDRGMSGDSQYSMISRSSWGLLLLAVSPFFLPYSPLRIGYCETYCEKISNVVLDQKPDSKHKDALSSNTQILRRYRHKGGSIHFQPGGCGLARGVGA